MRFKLWRMTFGLGCWLAVRGPRKRNGDRMLLPLARWVMKMAHPLWRDGFSPDY